MNQQERKDAWGAAIGEGVWGLGMGLIAPLTVMPLLIQALGGGPLEIGLIYGIATAGFLPLQPIGTLIWKHGGGKRNVILFYHILTALPLFALMAAVTWFLAPREDVRTLARVLLIVLFAARALTTGLIIPVWQDWMAGLFSTHSRGRALGLCGAASCVGVSVAALGAAWVRQRTMFPANYAALFAAATVLFGASLALFFRVSPGQPHPDRTRPRLSELLGRFRHSLRDHNFSRYLVGRVLLTTGSGATAFVAVHFNSPDGGGLSEAMIIGLGAFLTLPQALGSLWMGALGDRAGHRLGTLIGATAQIAAIAVAFVGTGVLACVLCFACLGLAYGAGAVSHQNMIYETCPHDSRVAHITVSNLVLGPFIAAVPLVTGYLVGHVGTLNTFAACMVPTVLGALWIIFMVHEPREIEVLRARNRTKGRRSAT